MLIGRRHDTIDKLFTIPQNGIEAVGIVHRRLMDSLIHETICVCILNENRSTNKNDKLKRSRRVTLADIYRDRKPKQYKLVATLPAMPFFKSIIHLVRSCAFFSLPIHRPKTTTYIFQS